MKLNEITSKEFLNRIKDPFEHALLSAVHRTKNLFSKMGVYTYDIQVLRRDSHNDTGKAYGVKFATTAPKKEDFAAMDETVLKCFKSLDVSPSWGSKNNHSIKRYYTIIQNNKDVSNLTDLGRMLK